MPIHCASFSCRLFVLWRTFWNCFAADICCVPLMLTLQFRWLIRCFWLDAWMLLMNTVKAISLLPLCEQLQLDITAAARPVYSLELKLTVCWHCSFPSCNLPRFCMSFCASLLCVWNCFSSLSILLCITARETLFSQLCQWYGMCCIILFIVNFVMSYTMDRGSVTFSYCIATSWFAVNV